MTTKEKVKKLERWGFNVNGPNLEDGRLVYDAILGDLELDEMDLKNVKSEKALVHVIIEKSRSRAAYKTIKDIQRNIKNALMI